jgi:hypothetical protein
MFDVLFVVITLVFFMLALAYVAACERLSGSAKASAERMQP